MSWKDFDWRVGRATASASANGEGKRPRQKRKQKQSVRLVDLLHPTLRDETAKDGAPGLLWLTEDRKTEADPLQISFDKTGLVSGNLPLVDAYLQAGLDALGDGTRMAIFQRLANGPMAVNELAGTLPVSRPAVSQHLRVLKDAGLVTDSKAGTRRMYQLDPEGVARLRAHFDVVWERALGAFQRAAVAPAVSPRAKKESGKKESGKKESGKRESAKRGEKHG